MEKRLLGTKRYVGDLGDHILWTVQAELDDIRELMRAPYEWVEDAAEEHSDENHKIKFDKNEDLILLFSYPFVKLTKLPCYIKSATEYTKTFLPWKAVIEGISETNILMIRILQPTELPIYTEEDDKNSGVFASSGPINVVIDPMSQLAYVHHDTGRGDVVEKIIAIVQNPTAYIAHLNRKVQEHAEKQGAQSFRTEEEKDVIINWVPPQSGRGHRAQAYFPPSPNPKLSFEIMPDEHFQSLRLAFIAKAVHHCPERAEDGFPISTESTTQSCTKLTCLIGPDSTCEDYCFRVNNFAWYDYPPGTPSPLEPAPAEVGHE